MGYRMITISESKKDKMCEYAEKAMKAIGKLTMCLSACDEEDDDFGEREFDPDWDDMNMRGGGYGTYYGYGRGGINMRRGVRGTGPYSRFR